MEYILYGNKLDGNDKEQGLLKKLSQRIGMLKQLSKYMTQGQLKAACEGIFTSRILYCLPLYSNVWGLANMDDTERRFSAFTKEDARKLQNKTLRLKSRNYELNVPTQALLNSTGDLSIQQLGAFHTALTFFKIVQNGQPKYLADKLILINSEN